MQRGDARTCTSRFSFGKGFGAAESQSSAVASVSLNPTISSGVAHSPHRMRDSVPTRPGGSPDVHFGSTAPNAIAPTSPITHSMMQCHFVLRPGRAVHVERFSCNLSQTVLASVRQSFFAIYSWCRRSHLSEWYATHNRGCAKVRDTQASCSRSPCNHSRLAQFVLGDRSVVTRFQHSHSTVSCF